MRDLEPKLEYYIEEFNKAGNDMQEAARRLEKYRKFARDDFSIDIACDGRVN